MGSEDDGSVERPSGSRLSTGFEELDRELGGGIPAGRTVAFIVPPDTQSELLLKKLLRQRSSLYLTTLRPKWEIVEELRDYLQKRPDVTPRRDEIQVEEITPDAILQDPSSYLDRLEPRSTLFVDAVNELERENSDQYATFLNTIKKRLWETGSIGLLYGIEQETTPPGRSMTLRRADLVLKLRMTVTERSVEHILVVSKFRGGGIPTEPINILLTDEVQIDTSRDIA